MKQKTGKMGLIIMALLLALQCFPMAASAGTVNTISGSLKDALDANVDRTWLAIQNTDTRDEYSAWVSGGEFTLSDLPAGQYEAVKYWDEALKTNVLLNSPFVIDANGTTNPPTLAFRALANNVTGAFDDTSLQGWLSISANAGNGQSFDTRVVDGKFGLNLPAGAYKVLGFWNEATQEYTNVKVPFTSPNSSLSLSLPLKNVTGTLKEGNAAIDGAWLNFYDITTNEGYGAHVVNGAFSLGLPDGNYRVSGYWLDNSDDFISLSQDFAVAGNTTLDIIVPARNITGTLVDEKGDLIGQAWLEIVNSAQPELSYNVNVKAGQFSLALPNGEYLVRGYWNNNEYVRLNLGQTVEGTESWSIKVPTRNVTGTLRTANDQLADQVWLNIQSLNQADTSSYDVFVRDGSFRLTLPNGTYRVNGYWDNVAQEYVQLNTEFVVSGTRTLALVVPSKNITGTLSMGDSPIGNAWLYIRSADYTRSYSAKVAADGTFGIALPNGSYVIDGYQIEAGNQFIRLNKSMGAVQGTAVWSVSVPAPNVFGTLLSSVGTPIDGVRLNLNKNEGERTWYDVEVLNGSFSLHLPDGQYFVSGYWDNQLGDTVVLDHLFTVSNGQASNTAIVVPSKNIQGTLAKADGTVVPNVWLSIRSDNHLYNYRTKVQSDGSFSLALKDGRYNVDGYYSEDYQKYTRLDLDYTVNGSATWSIEAPEANVKGLLIADVGETIPDSLYLHLYQVKQDGWYGYTVRVDNGAFSTPLPNGHYLVRGYSVNNNNGFEESYGFFSEFDISGQTSIEIHVPKKNITGTVTSSTGLQTGTINMVKSGGDDNLNLEVRNGTFNASLSEGTYTIKNFFDGVKQKSYVLDRVMTVTASGMHTWTIELPELNVHGNVSFTDGSSTSNLSIYIREVTAGNNASSSQVDLDNGQYSLYLPDGQYEVSSYYDRNDRSGISLRQPIQFTVNGDTSFDIVLPVISVKGTVYYPKKQDKFNNGWVIISNSEDSQAPTIWSEIHSDGTFAEILPVGSYRITEIVDGNNDQIRWPANQDFSVTSNTQKQLNVEVVAIDKNVHGVVQSSDSSAYNGQARIQSVPSQEGGATTLYYANVMDGKFDVYLPDGEYRVIELYNNSGSEALTDLNQLFTVADGNLTGDLVVHIQEKNVRGLIRGSNQQRVSGGTITIQTRDQDRTESRDYVVAQDGTFGLLLAQGTYYLMSYEGLGNTYLLPGDEIIVGEQAQILPEIILNEATIHGAIITDQGNPYLGEIQVSINKKNGDTGTLYYFNANQGTYGLYLPDGEYEIQGYYDREYNNYIPDRSTFIVQNGVADPVINIVRHSSNVNGTVAYDNSNPLPSQVALHIYRTDDMLGSNYYVNVVNGTFSFYLPEGTYTVKDVATGGGSNYTEYQLGDTYTFTVTLGNSNSPLLIVIPTQIP